MKEKILRFGRTAPLIGVLTEPRTVAGSASLPAVVLLNSGILHRVGACRLHVGVARRLARDGFTVLRFDYSGIGDSEARRDDLAFEESALLETREAMDHLASTRGVREFILMGLCSGADMAHEVARVDKRVVGLVMLDGWAYRNPGYYLHHYGSRAFRLDVWRRWIGNKLARARGAARAMQPTAQQLEGFTYEVPKYVRHFPAARRIAADLKDFVARGISMYFIFSGGQPNEYNHAGQYRRTFWRVPFGKNLREEFLPDADHIFTGLSHQQFVVESVAEWAAAWGKPAASASGATAPVIAPEFAEVSGAPLRTAAGAR